MTTKPANRVEFEPAYDDEPRPSDTIDAFRAVVYKDGLIADMFECKSCRDLALVTTERTGKRFTTKQVQRLVGAYLAWREHGFGEDWVPGGPDNAVALG